MKTTIFLAAVVFIACPSPASEPERPRRFETQYDPIAAVRRAIQKLKPRMPYDSTMRLLPLNGVLPSLTTCGGTIEYRIERWYRLSLSFDDDGLTRASLTRGDEVIERMGN